MFIVVVAATVLGLAVPASAHTHDVTSNCHSVTVNLNYYNTRVVNTVRVTVNGTVETDQTFPSSFVRTYEFANPYQTNTYRVKVVAGDNSRYSFDTGTRSVAGCPLTKDASASLTVSPPTCDSAGSVTVTSTVNASLVGSLDQSVGQHSGQFTADLGHAFADGSTTLSIPYVIEGQRTDCVKTDAALRVRAFTGCVKPRRSLEVVKRHNIAALDIRHNHSKTRWVVRARTEPGHLMRAHRNGTGAWTDHVRWVYHTPVPRHCTPHPHGS